MKLIIYFIDSFIKESNNINKDKINQQMRKEKSIPVNLTGNLNSLKFFLI